jgi:peptidoglycan/LPS O-acetylase OafA/YrhL
LALQYRTDIDGLRTLAVGLVILNHAGFSFFPGGFVGVDVFFVISGFLITSIITPKIIDKSFSIPWFLSRRIKRLMPVLFFITIITIAVFTVFMLPQDLSKFYRSVLWVIFYGANFFFWREHGGYFDGGSQEAPLLHTWSLAVEEQYYLFWPIMLIIMIRFLGANKTVWATLFLCVALTVFSQWGTEVTIGAAYYLLPTRFFELLVGSLLAITWHKLPSVNKLNANILSIIGLLLIIGSSLILTEHHSFPGYNALYPVIGTALLIYSQGGIVNRFFTAKPLVYTGNISYSLYLWHWPIFVIIRYLAIELTIEIQLFCIVLTYLLSVISYHYIEQPFRDAKYNSFKEISLKLYCYPTALIVCFISFGLWNNGFTNRFEPQVVAQEQAINSFSSDSRKLCHSALRDSARKPSDECLFGDVKDNDSTRPDMFIFGDSHANHIVPFVSRLLEDATLTGQDYTLDRCLPISNVDWGSNQYKANQCKLRNEQALQHIKSNNFQYVAIAASWPEIATKRIVNATESFEKRHLLESNLIAMLQQISDTGAIPVMIEDIPVLGGNSPKCPIKKSLFNQQLNCQLKKNPNILFNQLTTTAQRKFPNLIVIRPQAAICKGNACQMELDGIPLYRDEDHLNKVGAMKMAEIYMKMFTNPFSTSLEKG